MSSQGKTSLGRLNIPVCPKHGVFMKRFDIFNEEGGAASAWLCRVCYPDFANDGKNTGTWKLFIYRVQPTGKWHKKMEDIGLLDLNRAADLRRSSKPKETENSHGNVNPT